MAQLKTKIFKDRIPANLLPKSNINAKTYVVTAPSDFDELMDKKAKGLLETFATTVKTNIDVLKNATVVNTKDTIYYSFKIKAEKATSISVNFGRFRLSANATMLLYTSKEITDSISKKQNGKANAWRSRTYKENELNLLLRVPINELNLNSLIITETNFGYQSGVPGGALLSCEIDANCSTGASMSLEKKAVVLIENGNAYFTGTLLMNTCNNAIPYILTTKHGVGSGPGASGSALKYTFKFWSTGCGASTSSTSANVEMDFDKSELVAQSDYTDFALLKLDDPIPTNSDIVFSGWTTATSGITETSILHHPQGDLMKITTDNSAPVMDTYPELPNYLAWKLNIDFGATEAGSSGAAYFDQNHRVFAQHIGIGSNSSSCTQYEKWGGRFSDSWNGPSGSTSATRLKDWLDPNNISTGTTNSTNVSQLMQVPLKIMGPDVLCSEETYSLGTLPTGVTATWSSSSGIVSITPQNSNASTVTVTKVGAGVVTLTATFNSAICGLSNITKTIGVGMPTEPNIVGHYDTDGYNAPFVEQTLFCLKTYMFPGFYSGVISFNYDSSTTLSWSLISTYHPTSAPVTTGIGLSPGFTNTFDVYVKPIDGKATYRLTKTNECGSSYRDYTFDADGPCFDEVSRSTQPAPRLIIYPNPVVNVFTVTIKGLENAAKIMEVSITDKFGKVLKQLKYNGKNEFASIDFSNFSPDVYVIRVFDGKVWYSTKFIKQ